MTDNEKLIEEAAKALTALTDAEWEIATAEGTEHLTGYFDAARRVLAVFEKAHTPTGGEREAREAAWQEYLSKMRELDAQNNLAGRGLIPSHRDWHAGWDARAARRAVQGEPDALTIPRPHVPFGPNGVPEHEADAVYLDHAASNLEGKFEVGGSNVRATVVKLLRDTAAALRAAGGGR